MEYNTRAHIVRGLQFFTLIILIALAIPTVRWFFTQDDALVVNPSELDYGLVSEANTALERDVTGYVYVFGTPVDPTDPAASTSAELFAYDLESGVAQLVPADAPAQALEAEGPVYGFAIGAFTTMDNPADALHPGWIDYREGTITSLDTPSLWYEDTVVVPDISVTDRSYMAYAGMTDNIEPGTTEWYDLSNWQIVVHNPRTNDTRIIDNAAEPQWLNDGADLVYLKEDGIYRYNVATDASELLTNRWQNLSREARMAVAPDSSAFLLTVPNLGAITVYSFSDSLNGVGQEEGIIATDGVVYTDPVFHPNGREYTVLALSNPQPDDTFGTAAIEHRSVFDRTLLNSWTLDVDLREGVGLLDWRTDLVAYEWR